MCIFRIQAVHLAEQFAETVLSNVPAALFGSAAKQDMTDLLAVANTKAEGEGSIDPDIQEAAIKKFRTRTSEADYKGVLVGCISQSEFTNMLAAANECMILKQKACGPSLKVQKFIARLDSLRTDLQPWPDTQTEHDTVIFKEAFVVLNQTEDNLELTRTVRKCWQSIHELARSQREEALESLAKAYKSVAECSQPCLEGVSFLSKCIGELRHVSKLLDCVDLSKYDPKTIGTQANLVQLRDAFTVCRQDVSALMQLAQGFEEYLSEFKVQSPDESKLLRIADTFGSLVSKLDSAGPRARQIMWMIYQTPQHLM